MPRGGDAHGFYYEHIKSWLSNTKLKGDRGKLLDTLGLIKRLELKVSEAERSELRNLLKEAFGATDAELLHLIPAERAAEVDRPKVEPRPLPSGLGYVNDYVEMTAGQESPESFHAFALLTCVGAALGRKVWLDQVWFKVWPNLSVVLTGPAGGPRKTTAWDMAMATVEAAFREWKPKQISDASPQALVEELGKGGGDAQGFIYAPEFRQFFPSQNYMEGAVPLITRLLDNPDTYPVSRITRKATNLKNVTLSMAGGSTLDWMSKLPQDAQGGGFLTRVLLVHEEEPKSPKPIPKRQKSGVEAKVKAALTAIDQYGKGEVRLDAKARRWYDGWYKEIRKTRAKTPRLTLYFNRKPMHLLRLAMLTTLPMKVLKEADLEATATLMDWMEQPLGDVYKMIGMSKAGEMTRSVLDTIKALGGVCEYKTLAREIKGLLNKRDLRMAVDTLKDAGQLVEVSDAMEHTVYIKELGVVE